MKSVATPNFPRQKKGGASGESNHTRSDDYADIEIVHEEGSGSVPDDRFPIVDDRSLYDPCIRTISCRLDPFDSVSVHVDESIRGLLEYFVYYSSSFPNTWTYCPSSLHHAPSGPKIDVRGVVDAALEDDLMMNCVLSAAASRSYYIDDVQLSRWRDVEASATQQALRALQSRIDESSEQPQVLSERLVSSILHLGGAAFYRSDYSTARAHSNAAVMIAELAGGVTTLGDPYIQGRLLSLDDLLSCIELTPCSAERSYDPGPSIHGRHRLADLRSTSEESTAGSGLLDAGVPLSASWKHLVLQILDCYKVQVQLGRSESRSSPQTLSVSHWLTMRTLAIRSRLLALAPSDGRTNALRVALILWTLLPRKGNVKRYAKVVQTITPKLKTIMDQVLIDDWADSHEIRLWFLLMGYFCAVNSSDTQAWFAAEIRDALLMDGQAVWIGRRDADVFESLVAFQKRFFFHEPLLGPVTKELAAWLEEQDDFFTR